MDQFRSRILSRRSCRWIWFVATLGFIGACVMVVFRNPFFNGNRGVVMPGRVYRSAQPGNDFDRLARVDGLASVLNLRGGSIDDNFYVNEVCVTEKLGIAFYDFPMSPSREPTRRELLSLIDLFERCRYPLLIHCKQGADRTGLASALYLMTQRDLLPGEAVRAFSLYYGHVPLGNTARLHAPFREYQNWLDAHRLKHTTGRFRAWVEHDYQPGDYPARFTSIHAGPRVAIANDLCP